MKTRRTVLVAVVVALLVLGISAGGAGATSPAPGVGVHAALKVNPSVASWWGGRYWTNVWGKIRVENLTARKVHAICTLTLYEAGVPTSASLHLKMRIHAHSVKKLPWFIEAHEQLLNPKVHATCSLL